LVAWQLFSFFLSFDVGLFLILLVLLVLLVLLPRRKVIHGMDTLEALEKAPVDEKYRPLQVCATNL
jgi:hypothetical protein